MIITYIYHSCCAIEFEKFSVIIDFYEDAYENDNHSGKAWVTDYLLKKEEPLYVLCTHSHADHFNEEILSWDKDKKNITYIFSKEIKETFDDEKVTYLDKLQTYEDDKLTIKAFGSTDTGGSFYIQHEDAKIFHAGDLNNWHWNEEVSQDEAVMYENQYICELELVSEEIEKLDLVMFPLDPRLGEDFMLGGEQFINRVETDNFLPLHFGDNYELIKQFKPIALNANCNFLEVEHTGQSFTIKK